MSELKSAFADAVLLLMMEGAQAYHPPVRGFQSGTTVRSTANMRAFDRHTKTCGY